VAIPYAGNLLFVGGAALVLVLAVLGVLLLTRDRGPRDGEGWHHGVRGTPRHVAVRLSLASRAGRGRMPAIARPARGGRISLACPVHRRRSAASPTLSCLQGSA
jgi:hypothetical protein